MLEIDTDDFRWTFFVSICYSRLMEIRGRLKDDCWRTDDLANLFTKSYFYLFWLDGRFNSFLTELLAMATLLYRFFEVDTLY